MTSAIVCRQCGSMRVRAVVAWPLERAMATLLRQRVVLCNRCGWRGRVPLQTAPASPSHSRRRRRHHDEDPRATPVAHAEVDLAAIDKALESSVKK